jgi:hypothetical protein
MKDCPPRSASAERFTRRLSGIVSIKSVGPADSASIESDDLTAQLQPALWKDRQMVSHRLLSYDHELTPCNLDERAQYYCPARNKTGAPICARSEAS